MPHSPPLPRIGLLALTLEFYETLAPDLRRNREEWVRRQLLPKLEGAVEVLFDRAVFRQEDVESAVRGFEAAGADAILILLLTYSPSLIALPSLQSTRLPIILWNTQELWAVGQGYSTDDLLANHGVHGTQDLASVLVRSGVRFQYVTSHVNDADGLRELQDFFAAAATVARLRRGRLGLVGYPFPGMGDITVDTKHLTATLGCMSESLSVAEYNRRVADAAPQDVELLAEEYRQSYLVADDLTEADLSATARAELSLRSLVADRRLDAMSFQFLALGEDEQTETLPFVAVSRMMADGIGFAGEGDLVGAAGTWLLDRLCGPASFSEIFTIDFAGNSVLLSHMGEANVALARRDRKIPLVARTTPITRSRGRQLALVVNFEPGPATLFALAIGPGDRWRLIASRVTIENSQPITGLQSPHSKISSRQNIRDWLTAYARAGGPHHHAICFGDATARLKLAAELLDADYCEV